MRETVPFDLSLNFLLGLVLALFFQRELKEEESLFFHPYLGCGLVFECFFFMPLGVYLYYFYPAWSWMYFFDPNSLPEIELAVLGVGMVASYLVSLVMGFQLGQFLVRRNRGWLALILLGGGLLGLSLFCYFTLDRLFWVGDYLGWKRGTGAVFLLKHRLLWINGLMAILGFGSLVLLLAKLKGQKPSLQVGSNR